MGILFAFSGCGDDSGFNFLENSGGSGADSGPCDILSVTPSDASQVRMPATGATTTKFTVIPTSNTCRYTFSLNGTALTTQSALPYVDILPTSLVAGDNTLELTASDGVNTKTRTWTIRRNSPPVCSFQNPAVNGNSIGVAGTLWLTANAVDSEGDPLSFTWTDNGTVLDTAILFVTNGPGSSIGRFIPAGGQVGANHILANVSDGYDTATCEWNVSVANNCTLASFAPVSPTPRVSSIGGTVNTFTVVPNDGSCSVTWERNGATLPDTALTITVLSSDLLAGNNTVRATLTNGSSTVVKTWNVLKNTPPSCSGQSPAAGGNTVNVGSPITLTATATDINSDSLTFSWKANGSTANPAHFAITNPSGTQSQAIFTPISAYAGSNSISAEISDGLDTSSCTWAVNVINNCAFTGTTPSASTLRVSNVGTTSTPFAATPNDVSCVMSWTLNGVDLGSTSSLMNVLSSQLQPGINTLIATATNGLSTIQKTWTVVKNTSPSCDTLTPASSGNSVGVGSTINLRVDASDANSDSLSFSWKSNGTSVNPAQFVVSTPVPGASTVAFTPTAAYLGANTVSVDVFDGYDTASCSWSVTVANNCSVNSSLPSGATARVPAAAGSSSTFVTVPNDGSCSVTWQLNGVDVPGGAATFKNILSSALQPGANTLVATLSNGIGSNAQRTWTITKNAVPTCGSQTTSPNPTGSMLYTDTKTLGAYVSDSDGDVMVSYSWKFNGGTSTSLFPPAEITSTVGSSISVFHPTLSEVGPSRLVSVDFSDGYDTGTCQWSLDIDDPNAALVINACSGTPYTTVHNAPPPDGNAIALKSTDISLPFSVSASGTLLTYQWTLNSVNIPGATLSAYSLPYANLPLSNDGYSTLEVVVTDTYSNHAYCSFKVKKNVPPTITGSTPSSGVYSTINSASTLNMSVTTTDSNSDPLVYSWTLNGAPAPGFLPSGASSTTFNPSQQSSLLGDNTVAVTVTDTAGESATQQWTVNVNQFSVACNSLTAGQMCTLVGAQGVGNGQIPSADQTRVRIQPEYIIDDGSGNAFFSDSMNQTVWFWNRSGSTVTRLGMSVPAGQVVVVAGNGAPGRNEENLGYTYSQNKLWTPRGLAYDSANNRLFIADYSNNRVVKIDNTGTLTTVFGQCAAGSVACSNANDAAHNTDGSAGTSHSCPSPAGLWYYPTNSNLYIACYGTNVIKRLDLSTNNGYIVVGKLTAGATAGAWVDGTLGGAGTAQTLNPWDLKGDPNSGALYFTESSGSTSRVRLVNPTGSTITTFNDASGSANIAATDSYATPLTPPGSLSTAATSATPAAPSKIDVIGPNKMITNSCYLIAAVAKDAGGNLMISNAAHTFNLVTNGTGSFFSTAGCTGAPAGSIAIGTGISYYYFRPTAANTAKTITVNSIAPAGPTAGTGLTFDSAATGVASRFDIVGPATLPQGQCTPYWVQSTDGSMVASNTAVNRNILIDDGGAPGTLYSNSTCTTVLSQVNYGGAPYSYVTLSNATSSTVFYYRKTTPVSVAAGSVGTLFGNATNGVTHGSANTMTLGVPYGLALWFNGATLNGIFTTNQTNARVLFTNTTTSDFVLGGTRVGPFEGFTVMGNGANGYNGEDIGNTVRVNQARGLAINALTNQELVVADLTNLRIRTLDLSTSYGVTATPVGIGRARYGFISDSQMTAPNIMLNGPAYLYYNNSGNALYYSDSANSRIRTVNLKTGMIGTLIGTGPAGTGGGDGNTENIDAWAVQMRSPQGVTMLGAFTLYLDQTSNNCLLRAYNPGASTASLFGINILSNAVATVAGDFAQGCTAWNGGTPNVDGATAITNHMANGEGIASDGTSIYIAHQADHCILKVDSAGKMWKFLGTCGSAGFTDGLANTPSLFRYPTGIAMDPANPGNFFLTDQLDSTARVRYVNFNTSTVVISGVTVPAAQNGAYEGGAVIPYVKTLYSGTGGNLQRWTGIAAFDKWVCFSGGQIANEPGSHNITCRDRTNTNVTRFGLDETANTVTTRGGATLNAEQEGIDPATFANNKARFYAPYGLAFDSSGNLYIAERSGHTIRMIKKWW